MAAEAEVADSVDQALVDDGQLEADGAEAEVEVSDGEEQAGHENYVEDGSDKHGPEVAIAKTIGQKDKRDETGGDEANVGDQQGQPAERIDAEVEGSVLLDGLEEKCEKNQKQKYF